MREKEDISPCTYHTQLVSDIAVIKNDLIYIKERVCHHIEEGEEKGGFRDRLVVVELAVVSLTKELAALKTAKWMVGIVGGCIGGLISQLIPETIQFILKLLFKI